MAPPRYHVFVGAETGLLKGVNTEKQKFSNLNSIQEVNKGSEITCLRWKDESESEVMDMARCCGRCHEDFYFSLQIYAGLRSQVVRTFCPNSGVCKESIDVGGGTGPIKGIGVVNSHLVTCVSSGLLKVWGEDEDSQVEAQVGADVFRMQQHPHKPNLVATGGKENELKLWDLQDLQNPVFQAKNVKNDFLDLRVPVWVTDMQFWDDKVVAVTGHHQVRVYDPSSRQRRPVVDFEFDEYPLTCLSLTPRPEQVVVGNSRGRMALVDLRRKAVVHVFRGLAGSVRCVRCHPTLPLVASCGLDRFFKLHDLNNRTLLSKLYLKSRLNCLLLRTDLSVEEEEKEENGELVEADDTLWQEMEEVDETAEVSEKARTRQKRKVVMEKKKPKRPNKSR